MSALNESQGRNESKHSAVQTEGVIVDENGDYAISPPNGGWGWVVVFCAFYCNLVVDGIQLTFGIFLKPISKSMKADYSQVALAGSLMFGVHLLIGPICAGFNNTFGLRPVTIIGALICCFGVAMSYFATGYLFLCFSFGIIGGMGLGLVYMNALVITSIYFTSLLPVAIAIVVSGTGVGTVVFAGIGSYLLTLTNWRNSFLMEAALAGSMGLAAIAFKPLKPLKVTLKNSTSQLENEDVPTSTKKSSIFVKTKIPNRLSHSSLMTLQSLAWSLAENLATKDIATPRNKRRGCCWCCKKNKSLSNHKIIVLEKFKTEENHQKYVEKNKEEEIIRISPLDQHSSVSFTSVYTRLSVSKKKQKPKLCQALKKSIIAMTDCHLLEYCSFVLFTLSGAVQMAAMLVVFIYVKERVVELGFTEESSVFFLMTIGGANVFWRVTMGSFATFCKIHYLAATVSGTVIGGIATMCSGYCSNFYFQIAFCVIFAFTMATFSVFRIILLVQLVGIEKVTTATGINLLFMGVLCIIFPPVLGCILDGSRNYTLLFFITGILIILSGFLMIGMIIKPKPS